MASRTVPARRLLSSLGARVAELRIARGLTQEKLAERMGVAPRYVQQIEGGRQNITVSTAGAVARVLRVELAELFTGSNRPPRRGLRRVPTRAKPRR